MVNKRDSSNRVSHSVGQYPSSSTDVIHGGRGLSSDWSIRACRVSAQAPRSHLRSVVEAAADPPTPHDDDDVDTQDAAAEKHATRIDTPWK